MGVGGGGVDMLRIDLEIRGMWGSGVMGLWRVRVVVN